jgi:hypothetical protein
MSHPVRLISIFLLASLAVFGQADANKGQIVGTVYDANQAVVPNAAVRIKNLDTGLARELWSNDLGRFRAVALDPGRYEVVAESAGFAPATLSGLVLNVGSTVDASITLQVASTTTVVEVGETLINVSLATQSPVLNNDAIRTLPINGRRFQDFALAFPTVQVEDKRNQLSFAGQKGINSNVMVDGADYNQPFFGGIRGGERSNFSFTVPQSAIQEFQIVPTGYTAEYGRSTGGVMNVITKSGANDYHGEAFYQLRHKEMGRANPFGFQSLETQHQWGGAAGGPLVRDKWFWFGAVERQDARIPRRVYFTRLDLARAEDRNLEAYQYFRSLEEPFNFTNDAIGANARTDYQFAGGDRLTVRYNMSRSEGLNATSVGNPLDPFLDRSLANNGTEQDRTHTGGVQFTKLLGPAVVNDLRFAVTYEQRPRLSNSEAPQVNATWGRDGSVDFLPNTQDDKRIQIADSLSWTRGPHTLKFGLDYNRLTIFQTFGFNQFGAFALSGCRANQILAGESSSQCDVRRQLDVLTPGGSVANRFDDSSVTYRRQIGNLLADYGAHQFALYAQDSWRALSSLTIDFGLRWEGQWNPSPEANNAALIDRVRGFRFPIGMSVDPTTIRDNTQQFMPRFGVAYSPLKTRRMVVRGHTGIFYASTPLLLLAGPMNNWRLPPGDVSLQITNPYPAFKAIGIDLNTHPLGDLPIFDIETIQRAATGTGTAPDPFRGANLLAWASDYRNPRAVQAGFGVDYEPVSNLVVGVQTNYVNTVHLQRNRDFNLPAPVVRGADAEQRPFFGLRSGGARPIPTLGSVWVRETTGRSMYRGLTFSSQYRTRRAQFGAFYTWSEAFSDDDQERDATGFRHENAFNLRSEYGYSDLDMRHQFTGYGVVNLPFGIEASSRFRFTSGKPVNALTGADSNEDLASNDRPFVSPGVSMERNAFRNRAFSNVDVRLLKSFPVRERVRIQFSTELFNVFDFDNVIYAGSNIRHGPGPQPDPNFLTRLKAGGAYHPDNTQVGGPLQAQFGLRLIF